MQINSLRTTLKASVKDGLCYSFMLGSSETYFAAFVLALGFSEVASGLLAVWPALLAAFFQLFSYIGVAKLQSRKKWIILCSFVQTLCLLILGLVAYTRHNNIFSIFLILTLFNGVNLSCRPLWNAWIGGIVPRKLHTTFFSTRFGISQIGLFIGIILSGLILSLFNQKTDYNIAYLCLFIMAAIARIISTVLIIKQYEPTNLEFKENPKLQFFKKIKNPHYTTLFLYLGLLSLGMAIASPFYTAYMFKHLSITYEQFTVIMACTFFAKIIGFKYMGKVATKRGYALLIFLSLLGTIVIPLMWIGQPSFIFLMGINLLTGFFAATHQLGILLLLLKNFDDNQRSDIISMNLFLTSVATFIGSAIGAAILIGGPIGHQSYSMAFTMSAIFSLSSLFILPQLLFKTSKVSMSPHMMIFFKSSRKNH